MIQEVGLFRSYGCRQRPVICLDWGGPGFQVNDETGFKIYPTSPDQVVTEMAIARKLGKKIGLSFYLNLKLRVCGCVINLRGL